MRSRSPLIAAVCLALLAGGCAAERERRRFDCDGLGVSISTRQRVPDSLGGEEFVYATVASGTHPPVKNRIDRNGRWTDRLGVSIAEDRTWLRFYLTEPSVRRRYVYLAYIHVTAGTLIRSDLEHSTQEERDGGWFSAVPELASQQTLRGQRVTWRPCVATSESR